MEDNELNVELAKAMGWTNRAIRPTRSFERAWYDTNRQRRSTNFATSVDALAPVEERLRDAGWLLSVHWTGIGDWIADWVDPKWPTPIPGSSWVSPCLADAPTESRARAEACLAALTHLQPITAELDTEQEQS